MNTRKNIFEIISSRRSPYEEIVRIEELFTDRNGVYVSDEIFKAFTKGEPNSIVKYIDDYLFKNWTARGTCICTSDMKNMLSISEIPNEDELLNDADFIFRYCEYAANMVYLLKNKVLSKDKLSDNAEAIRQNLQIFLDWYNYEIKYYEDKEKALIIAKNASATAAAETLNDELAYSVIEYNHYLLRGNTEKKKSILRSLGNDLEPKRVKIKTINKQLESDIFFMLNNLNIRHNNRDKNNSKYIERVAKMRLSTLEKWYDELYQMMLLAYLLLDNDERALKVKALREKVVGD